MSTPYITPAMLLQADTGIDWSTIVPGHTNDSVTDAEQANICWRATETADLFCNQVLRATLDAETVDAPGERAVLLPNGTARLFLSRWPVIYLASVQVAISDFPPTWNSLPPGSYRVRNLSTDTVSGAGAYSIDIAPGYVSWMGGRYGYQIQVEYINGWPHASTTASALAGATSLVIDDVTGFLAGQEFTIYDGANTERLVVASASSQSGPGTVTLVGPTAYAHAAGVLATALPAAIQQACIYIATYIALTRGATAVAIPPVRGLTESGQGKPDRWLMDEAERRLQPYRRVV